MKDITKNIIKAVAIALAFALIVSSIFIIRSCSAPPDYEEIRARVEELVEASFDVNDIVWGKGLPTYKRVYATTRTLYESGETYIDSKGQEQPLNYYYYYVSGLDDRIIAFRKEKEYVADFSYAYISDVQLDAKTLTEKFPLAEGQENNEAFYTEIFADAESKKYIYLVPFVEPDEESFYYVSSDPTDYDYVLAGEKYASIDAIKEYVRTVYASDYADSLDSILFDGVMEGDLIQKARYMSVESGRGTLFASLNTFEPLFEEHRVYLYDTARIDRSNSNDTSVVVEFSTYLPSAPDDIVLAKLSFTLQDGVWYLASPTY